MSDPPSTILVSVEKGKAADREYSFGRAFKIGRDDECEVRLQDSKVSRFHAEVRFAQGKWWLIDLKSTNGIFVDGQSKDDVELTETARVEFGSGGPVLSFTIVQAEAGRKNPSADLSLTELQRHYFEARPGETAGAHTMMIRTVYGQLKKKQKRKFLSIIGVLACLVVALGVYGYMKHLKVKKQIALAENIFYSIKSQEIEFADLLREARQSKDIHALEIMRKYQARRSALEQKYDQFLKGLDVYGKGKSEEERLILSTARAFGECEVAMPAPFTQEVMNYIGKWKSTHRLERSIELAEKNGYPDMIAKAMKANDMPPQFFYLALVESNFNVQACGPPTRFGIAKGMWQFIPTTARSYGFTRYPGGLAAVRPGR